MIIRDAEPGDAEQMAAILNAIIQVGGTTAITQLLDGDELRSRMSINSNRSVWHVAVSAGDVVGFQWAAPHRDLPHDVCDIATFVKIGGTQRGIGSKMLAKTKKKAAALGYREINANIRADNIGGLTFYSRQGFADHTVKTGVMLSNGLKVDKIYKRLKL